MREMGVILYTVIIFFSTIGTGLTAQQLTDTRPNIILINTDDQGYGDIGFTGNSIINTPNIDMLANQSTRFTNFHVDPTCAPSRAALLTGKNSLHAGVWHTEMGRHFLPTE